MTSNIFGEVSLGHLHLRTAWPAHDSLRRIAFEALCPADELAKLKTEAGNVRVA
jgi:hypothetical protein